MKGISHKECRDIIEKSIKEFGNEWTFTYGTTIRVLFANEGIQSLHEFDYEMSETERGECFGRAHKLIADTFSKYPELNDVKPEVIE